MNAPLRQPALAPAITQALTGLRSKIRGYVWAEGLLAAAAWLGIAFWISFAADRLPVLLAYDDPERWVRIVMLAGIAAVLAGIVYWTIFRRIFVALSDRSMAILIERRFRQFDDSLLTTVELHEQPDHAEGFNPEMLDFTSRHALRHAGDVPLADVFNPGPRIRNAILAVVALGSVVAFAVWRQDDFKTWFQRCILLQDDVFWPRYNHLEIVDGKVRKSAVGDDVTIQVKAPEGKVPDNVRIIHSYADGSGGSDNMNKLGAELREEEGQRFQYYTYTYRGLVDSVQFEVVGGDFRLRDCEIIVVDRPRFASVTLDVDFPSYINEQLQRVDVVGQEVAREEEEVPEGSSVRIHCRTNKPLVPGEPGKGTYLVISRGEEGAQQTELLEIQEGDLEFEFNVGRVTEDVRLAFSLLDSDGISTKDPIPLVLTPKLDQPPEVKAAFYGVGEAITPDARLPIRGDITDDYGVVDLRYRYRVEGGLERDAPFLAMPKERRSLLFSQEIAQKENRPEEALDFLERRLAAQAKQRDVDAWRKYAARAKKERGQPPSEAETAPPENSNPPGGDPSSSSSLNFSLQDPPTEPLPDEDAAGEGSGEESAEPMPPTPDPGLPMPVPMPAPPEQPSGEPIVAPEMGEDVDDIDLAAAALQPGQTVIVSIRATDGATVGQGPYTGTSNEHILRVVTAEELRGLLASKELNARINLERVRDEFSLAKLSLDSISFNLDELKPPAAAPTEGETPAPTGEGAPPGEAPPAKMTMERLYEEHLHRCQRAMFKSEENRNELVGITEFFKALRQEYENNRLDTDEVKARLTDGIIKPLERLHVEMYPELDDRLERLMARLNDNVDPNVRDQAHAEVREQAQLIRDTLVDVLAKMKEMENYNEVIRLLREILEEKNALIRETKKASQSLP